MFASGCNYDKLKTNLRLSMSRLKLGQKKKAELAQKSRKEIADYISNSKPDRARIRVEHIIREDYYVEAMEMMEMYCDLLLARMGLIQQLNTLDPGIAESVSSIIWAGPRMVADCPELKAVCDQLTNKYGKLYVQGVREQSIDTVNAKLMHRLSADPPPRNLVESYLKEIAAAHGVKYEPQFVDDDNDQPGNGGIGELIDMGVPDAPSMPGFRTDLMNPSAISKPAPMAPAFEPPMPVPGVPYQRPDAPGPSMPVSPPAFRPPQPPQKQDTPYDPPSTREDIPPPSYDSATMGRDGVTGVPRPTEFPPDVPQFPDIPDLPDVPRSDNATPQDGTNADVDFDELTKRFEELKKRK